MAFAYFQCQRPREIAALLGVSPASFKTYRKELYARLGVTSEPDLRDALFGLARSAAIDLQRHRHREAWSPVRVHRPPDTRPRCDDCSPNCPVRSVHDAGRIYGPGRSPPSPGGRSRRTPIGSRSTARHRSGRWRSHPGHELEDVKGALH